MRTNLQRCVSPLLLTFQSGELVIVASTQRKQEANMRECLHKLDAMLEEASWLPKERIITTPPAWSKEKRLEVVVSTSFLKVALGEKEAIQN